jgi:hypothetical protein
MKEHIRIFKSLCASLVAIEKLVSDKEKVFFTFSQDLVNSMKASQQLC